MGFRLLLYCLSLILCVSTGIMVAYKDWSWAVAFGLAVIANGAYVIASAVESK